MTQVTLDSTIYLSVGDGATADYIDLNNASGAFEVAFIDLSRPFDRRLKNDGRMITLGVTVSANTATGIWDKLNNAIEVKLDQARLATDNPQGGHTGVTLGVQIGSSSTMVYFDVVDGNANPSREAMRSMMLAQGLMLWSDRTQGLILELECEPLGRSDAVSYGPFDITKADGFAMYQAAIPGTAPGIATYTITDQTSGQVLNKVLIGHRSQPDLDDGDWDPVLNVSASGDGSDTGSQTDAVNSDYAGVTTAFSNDWSEIGEALPATDYADQTGKYNVYARIYDSLTVPKPPTSVRTGNFLTTGSMPEGNYTVVVTTIITGSYESLPSAPINFTVSAPTDSVTINWVVSQECTPTDHNIYWKRDNNDWLYHNGTVNPTFNLTTESGATTSDPPSTLGRFASSFRGRVSLSSGTTVLTGQEQTPRLSNGQYEMMELFSGITLPPVVLEEGGTVEQWRVATDVHRRDGNTQPTARVDAIWILPSNSIVEAEYLGLNLGTAREWVIGGTRHGDVHGVIRNTSGGAETGQVSVYGNSSDGGIVAGPGDTTWAVLPLIAAGVSNVGAIDLSISVSIIPRWSYLIGTV